MKFKNVRAEVKNVNSRPESSGDEQRYASDIKVAFAVPTAVINALFPGKKFMDQFYKGDDVILTELYPIKFNAKQEDLRAVLTVDGEDVTFEPTKIKSGMELTPIAGDAVSVECTLQVYPADIEESGWLDWLAKQWIELKIEKLTRDIDD